MSLKVSEKYVKFQNQLLVVKLKDEQKWYIHSALWNGFCEE